MDLSKLSTKSWNLKEYIQAESTRLTFQTVWGCAQLLVVVSALNCFCASPVPGLTGNRGFLAAASELSLMPPYLSPPGGWCLREGCRMTEVWALSGRRSFLVVLTLALEAKIEIFLCCRESCVCKERCSSAELAALCSWWSTEHQGQGGGWG